MNYDGMFRLACRYVNLFHFPSYISVKQLNQTIMKQETRRVLKSWETSLERYGKIDSWRFSQDLTVLGECLRAKEESKKVLFLIHGIRDRAVSPTLNVGALISLIKKTLCECGPESNEDIGFFDEDVMQHRHKKGQDVRFRSETIHIFDEKLRFRNGMPLRNFDIETEPASDSKKVRRIVEKRMCQAYHRMSGRQDKDHPSNRDRYWRQRATAFQLYNIGQMENVEFVSRGGSTHWKRMYDPYTGRIVFKKKMAYATEQEALEAIETFKRRHPFDKKIMSAYKCTECNKWHIGHDNPISVGNGITYIGTAC